jgi:diaminohydroxyphosphoribosylaminopyrimidine deaminase/5-amino-6-(5-phosphoribosylamino)uracil reductase
MEAQAHDHHFMQMALDLARQGAGHTSPNPMVGALLVKQGRIVGQGYHAKAGGAHAEVNAIADAGDEAAGATLYVTLEPCHHTGRTPPCTRSILAARIARVVVAMADPNPHVSGGGGAYLTEQGIKVVWGVLESEAQQLNEAFVKHARSGRPFVYLKYAATLDGRLAAATGDARWVTGPKARAFVHQLRQQVDAIMVGIGTVVADDPSLTTRLPDGKGVDPQRIILDPQLRIDERARLLHQQTAAATVLVTGDKIGTPKRARLEAAGAEVMRMPLQAGQIDLTALMEKLGARGICSVLIEGGGGLIGTALRSGVVDKVYAFLAPKLLAGDDGVPVCRGAGAATMDAALVLDQVAVRRFDEDTLVVGYINNGV